MYKMKNICVLFGAVLYSAQVYCTFHSVVNFLEHTATNITRVRTPVERDHRWRDFAVLDFVGLVQQHNGYTAEEYDVQTIDGYVLKLHRISGSPLSPKAANKPPVYIGHGICMSSDVHVIFEPHHALPFLLANAGYDVWIGNSRGNTYSNRHIKYSTNANSYDFWNFSLDEMALIDLPLFIDTILEKTNKQKLTYIGYSMGGTLSFILLSSKPEYNDKMNVVLNMAPAVIFTHPLDRFIRSFTSILPQVKSFLIANHIYRILPQSKLFQILGKDICGMRLGAFVCKYLLGIIFRIDQLDPTVFPVLFSYVPSGTSVKVVDHYYQMMISGKFRSYDYGVATNRAKYNTASPPEYDLSLVTSPQAIFYAKEDRYAGSQNVAALKSRLPNVVAFEVAPEDYNHIDFVLNVNAKEGVYYKMLEIIAKYS